MPEGLGGGREIGEAIVAMLGQMLLLSVEYQRTTHPSVSSARSACTDWMGVDQDQSPPRHAHKLRQKARISHAPVMPSVYKGEDKVELALRYAVPCGALDCNPEWSRRQHHVKDGDIEVIGVQELAQRTRITANVQDRSRYGPSPCPTCCAISA